MADITKCTAKNCKVKNTCYRYTAYDSVYQSYADFNGNKKIKEAKECKYYIKGKKEGDTNERKNA